MLKLSIMENVFILQILLSGLVIGIILFQSILVAPIVFKYLEPNQSRIFIRKIFPKFFRFLFSIGFVMLLLILIYGEKYEIQYIVGLTTFILPIICRLIIPAANKATDENNKNYFRFLHTISVVLTMLVLISNAVWLLLV